MKLSFSTLGCPRWTLKEIVATAKDLGFGGVEIRGIGDKINALEIPEFSDAEIEQTKEKIAQAGLVIPSDLGRNARRARQGAGLVPRGVRLH